MRASWIGLVAVLGVVVTCGAGCGGVTLDGLDLWDLEVDPPDFDPPDHGPLVYLLPVPEGCVPVRSDGTRDDRIYDQEDTEFGDDPDDVGRAVVVTYDLGPLRDAGVDPAAIQSAWLPLEVYDRIEGDPWGDLEGLLIEPLQVPVPIPDLPPTDPALYFGYRTPLAPLTVEPWDWGPQNDRRSFDVTEMVRWSLEQGLDHLQLRVRFALATDGDGAPDTHFFWHVTDLVRVFYDA